ncbi:T9SS type A sorting domain-containing protein [Candidatus Marinimicrobia bacterium]|nr:T9SS type A sorting domain-containing protein [Candidatus Neomarinimicrobiota bacterium]
MTQLFLILSMCISSVLAITVEAGNFYYSPSDIVIDAGETVQWENVQGTHDVDGTTNNITNQPWNNPEDFYLGTTSTGDMGSITFTLPGIYNYDCGLGSHAANGMVGTITVNAVSDQGCQDSNDCEEGSFCNMDDDDASCESCGSFAEMDDCYNDGLPDAGVVECANTCFGDDDCASGIYDCAGNCDGDSVFDECGICDGEGADVGSQGICDCDGNIFDCSGVCGGSDMTCDMMRTSSFGFYENNDCSGEFVIINGMCLNFSSNDIDSFTMFNEDACTESGGLWLLGDTCHAMMYLFSLDQDACEENGSLWMEETDEYGYTVSVCLDIMIIEGINSEADCENYEDTDYTNYSSTMWSPNHSGEGPMLYIYDNGIWSGSEEEYCRYSEISQEDCENGGAEWNEYDSECNIDDQQTCESIGGVWFLDGVHEQGTWAIVNGEITLTAYDGTDLPGAILGAGFTSNEMGNLLTLNIQFETYEFLEDDLDEAICIEYGFENIDSQLENTNISIPSEIKIENVYPNPFNPVTTIDFSVSQPNHIDINIYDLNGKFVKSINSKQYAIGNYSETIDISGFTSGVYFVRLELENRFLTQKLMLLK